MRRASTVPGDDPHTDRGDDWDWDDDPRDWDADPRDPRGGAGRTAVTDRRGGGPAPGGAGPRPPRAPHTPPPRRAPPAPPPPRPPHPPPPARPRQDLGAALLRRPRLRGPRRRALPDQRDLPA